MNTTIDEKPVKCSKCGQYSDNSKQLKKLTSAMANGELISKFDFDNVIRDRNEWREQHENLLLMYRTASDERAALKALLSQGEPVAWQVSHSVLRNYWQNCTKAEYDLRSKSDIDSGWKWRELFTAPPSTEPSQGEPVAWTDEYFTRVINNTFKATGIFDELNKPLYEAPPSTESLQKDKAELIEYAECLVKYLAIIEKSVHSNEYGKMLSNTAMASLAKDAIAIPQPKCME